MSDDGIGQPRRSPHAGCVFRYGHLFDGAGLILSHRRGPSQGLCDRFARDTGCAGAGRRRDRMRLLFVAMSAIPDWNLTDLMTVVKSGPVAKNRLVPFRPDRRPNPGRRSSYSVEGSQFIASSNAFARSRCMVTGAISSRARLASPGASLLSANPFRRVRVSLCAATCCSR